MDATALFRDLRMPAFNGDAASIVDVRQPLYGVGLTGWLPPDAALLFVPYGRRHLLAEYLRFPMTLANLRQRLVQFAAASVAAGYSDEIVVLRAGEVLTFQTPLTDGISVYACTLTNGSGIGLSSNAIGYADDGAWGVTNPTNNTAWTPHPRAFVRVYTSAGLVPQRLIWSRVPFAQWMDSLPALATPPHFVISPDSRWVSVHMIDDDPNTLARIQGVETGDYEIYWHLADGLYAHRPTDDFDAAGRGAATASHDFEVYEVPYNVFGISIVRTGGSLFGAVVISS